MKTVCLFDRRDGRKGWGLGGGGVERQIRRARSE